MPRYVRITDAKALEQAGCPWKATTLRQLHYLGKHPKLLTKVGSFLMIDLDELKVLQEKGKQAPTGV